MNTFALDKDYNRDDFVTFLPDFLPDDFESTEEELYFDYTNIEKGFKLGSSDCINLDVFEFQTKSKRDSRVTLTKEVVSFMKKYSSNQNALVVFFSENSHNWRLSLITTDYEIINGKINRLYSNPRRFSFKLGEDGKTHTPTTQLFKKGQIRERSENGKILTCFEDLQSRFAIEVVSDEFFKEYKVFYEDFVQYITGNRYLPKAKEKTTIHEPNKEIFPQFLKLANNDIEIACKYVRDYIKKLMGRLVFLHFLQKKGWLGVKVDAAWGTGDKSYLLNLFKQSTESEKDNFLEKVLEPLFFGMLNTSEDERTDLFNSKNWDSKLLSRFNRIPYLNGGLFEADELDEVIVSFPKELFSNEKACDAERKYQDKIKPYPYTNCCGLLDFFARYNFTIDETDPTDMEIGVEPEMLGKIFENLLEDNKDKGAFYTPKEIVQYMCRESLIAYLVEKVKADDNEKEIRDFILNHHVTSFIESNKEKIVDALCSVKICDPAVGSGAFPMGMLNELFYARIILKDKDTTVGRAHIKKEIVKNNIYGVDIEKGAVDIARLRFWLAIVVDEDEPSPLPNLDYKIMQGNSLLESYEGVSLYDEEKTEVDETVPALFSAEEYKQDIQRSLEAATDTYFNLSDHKMKAKYKSVINQYTKELIVSRTQLKKEKNEEILRKELETLNLDNNTHFFLWHTWFSDVFNRTDDCNGFDIVIGNPPYISAPAQIVNSILNDQRERLIKSQKYKSMFQKWDLYILFIELGMQLNCKNGICSMIVPFPLTNQLYAQKLRKMIVEENNLFELCDLNGTKIFDNATVSNCISFIKKSSPKEKLWISNIDENRMIKKTFEKTFSELVQDEKTLVWNVTQEKRETNKHSDMNVLGDFCYISVGMVLNSDENSKDEKFVKSDLISEKKDPIHCQKYIEGKDLEKYFVKRIRYLEWGTARSPSKLRRPTFEELYTNKKLLINSLGDLKASVDNGEFYYCEQQVRMALLWKDLQSVENKSITSSIKKFSKMTRDEMENLSETVDLKYLLGIMNSKYASVLLTNIRGGDYHIVPEHIRNIPIPTATKEQQQSIISLVDKILESKKADTSADISSLEKEIDSLVYKLYDLSKEEIDVIERN